MILPTFSFMARDHWPHLESPIFTIIKKDPHLSIILRRRSFINHVDTVFGGYFLPTIFCKLGIYKLSLILLSLVLTNWKYLGLRKIPTTYIMASYTTIPRLTWFYLSWFFWHAQLPYIKPCITWFYHAKEIFDVRLISHDFWLTWFFFATKIMLPDGLL